ncbi:MAG: ATP-dependent RNA helicase DbpA [Oceanicoccus sp.]|uniref:ATP-dependent RNA helicase DbpA n=1 Tax=Oceanicoccus sp. TaxID=2691044 RepID=UPI00260E5FEE|nr:ATP-dependent RNA helicase DbpA [Oceanicoccus sp.]MCP3907405.1 ATP-dependent RNA helicase DbpA [Oceanicoccus sp.]MDG1772417.1 ATP-dependent RNA helicase DbpA [Oceanicoccus sp.]
MTDTRFSALNLPPAQLDNLDQLGYQAMTPIQQQSLPLVLEGKDIIAQAKTGSGKTAAFAIAMLTKINPRDFGAQSLVLCPTRELSTQVATEIRRLARYRQNIKVVVLCGGQSIGPQIGSLEHGAHIIVGTPGRIKDHLRKKTLNLSRVNTLVLDEADRMLDMGFYEDMETIIKETPSQRQTLLFSATYPKEIKKLSASFQQNPIEITVESIHSSNHIQQRLFITSKSNKLEGLLVLLGNYSVGSAVIFCNTIKVVKDVCEYLREQGLSAKALHGDLEQRDRDQVLVQFSHRSCSLLIATDVAARGLDIDNLEAVINFDLPRDPEIYIHRIGRTGRAGKEGLAFSLFSDAEKYKVEAIAEYQNLPLDFDAIDTLDPHKDAVAEPPMVSLCIGGGRKEKVRPGDILGALTGDAGIEGKTVGKITVLDHVAYVAIDRAVAGQALKRLEKGKIKGRKFKVRQLR